MLDACKWAKHHIVIYYVYEELRPVLVLPELECIDIFHLTSNSLIHQEKAAASLLSPSWK